MIDYILSVEPNFWTNPGVVKSFLSHLRLTPSEVATHQDGLSYQDLNLNWFQTLVFRVFRRWPSLPKMLWGLYLKRLVRKVNQKWLTSSAGLVGFTMLNASKHNLIELGQVSYRVWLTLVSKGYGVQPLSSSSLPILDAEAGGFEKPGDPDFYKRAAEFLRGELQCDSSELPVWIFRFGKVSNQGRKPMSAKRKISDILKISDKQLNRLSSAIKYSIQVHKNRRLNSNRNQSLQM